MLLRCAEEGLRNARTHGKASEVEVILDDDGEQVMLTVRDNGVGPHDCAGAMDSLDCHGLRLLRERARYLGGELVLARAESGGALLRMTLPREAHAA